jgi:hypothetical protein
MDEALDFSLPGQERNNLLGETGISARIQNFRHSWNLSNAWTAAKPPSRVRGKSVRSEPRMPSAIWPDHRFIDFSMASRPSPSELRSPLVAKCAAHK